MNLDPAAARAIGVQPGAGIEVAIPELSFTAAAIYSPQPALFGFLALAGPNAAAALEEHRRRVR